MGASKLPLSQLKGHDEDTAKKQHSGSVEARINNDRVPHCKTPGWGTIGVLLERPPPPPPPQKKKKKSSRLPKEGATI